MPYYFDGFVVFIFKYFVIFLNIVVFTQNV